jgi:hypothetical protein
LRRWLIAGVALAGLAIAVQPRSGAAEESVDLELVLAADISLSMDVRELRLQRAGYATAITAPRVLEAIADGFDGRIAVTFVEWAGAGDRYVTVPWQGIATAADAERFAEAIRVAPLRQARRTSISAALDWSAGLFDDNGFAGYRRVIDISGDGPNNQGEAVDLVRDRVVARGVVINGLPLMIEALPVAWYNIPDLDRYYENCVIGGVGSFYIPVQEMRSFADALIRKLVLEIARTGPPARLVTVQSPAAYDCRIGEKLWRERMRYLE